MPIFGTVFFLNLPRKVSKGTGSLEYIYDAAGNKLAKILNGTVVNFYCGSVVYTGSKAVEYVAHPEGIAHKSGSGFSYQYNQTDHLGNVRSVADASKAVVQATDYFPFGLAHSTSNLAKNKYLYNGKELQNDVVGGTPFGQLDYGARMYDATLGVWRNIDPLAEKYYSYSPYVYCANNPLIFIDPDGRELFFSFDQSKSLEEIEKMKKAIAALINHMFNAQFEVTFKNTSGTTYQIGLNQLKGGDKSKLTQGGKMFHEGLSGVINSKTVVNIDVFSGSKEVSTGNFILEAIDVADIDQYPQFNLSKKEQTGPTKQGKFMHEVREQFFKASNTKKFEPAHDNAISWENHVNGNVRVGDNIQTFYKNIGDMKKGEIISVWAIDFRSAIVGVTQTR